MLGTRLFLVVKTSWAKKSNPRDRMTTAAPKAAKALWLSISLKNTDWNPEKRAAYFPLVRSSNFRLEKESEEALPKISKSLNGLPPEIGMENQFQAH